MHRHKQTHLSRPSNVFVPSIFFLNAMMPCALFCVYVSVCACRVVHVEWCMCGGVLKCVAQIMSLSLVPCIMNDMRGQLANHSPTHITHPLVLLSTHSSLSLDWKIYISALSPSFPQRKNNKCLSPIYSALCFCFACSHAPFEFLLLRDQISHTHAHTHREREREGETDNNHFAPFFWSQTHWMRQTALGR